METTFVFGGEVGGLCRLTLGRAHAVINITRCTDTRCARGRLERILNCTKMEFLGNFQGVLRAGTDRRAEIYTGKKREFCGVMALVITPGPAAMPWAVLIISTLSFWGQSLQFPSFCGSDFHMLTAKTTSVLPLLLLTSWNFSSRKELLVQEQQTLVRSDLSMLLPQGPTASPLLSKSPSQEPHSISSLSPPLWGGVPRGHLHGYPFN